MMIKRRSLLIGVLFLLTYCSYAQGVGIGNAAPDASAVLDITSTNKGLLIPRMSTASLNNIGGPARGLLVYDSVANQLMVNIGTSSSPNWQPVADASSGSWTIAGNSNIAPGNFIGTINNQPLQFRVNNLRVGELHSATGNIFWGLHAGENTTTGFSNVAIGSGALQSNKDEGNLVAIGDSALFNNDRDNPVPGALGFANTAIGSKSLFSNTIGSGNTASGVRALFSNIDGSENTAYGLASLSSNTSGGLNTAVGAHALASNTTGNDNTATGWEALHSNTTGVFNTASGSFSLDSNTTGNNNTATGFASLNSNTTGNENTGSGIRSLFSNTTGSNNTAVGSSALFFNTAGHDNTATGWEALLSNTTGIFNTAVGVESLASSATANQNTAVGYRSLFRTTAIDNTATGFQSLLSNTSGINNSAFGSNALESNTTGFSNSGFGANSLLINSTGSANTAMGTAALSANTTGQFNTAVGFNALSFTQVSDENTVIGNAAASLHHLGFNNTIVGSNADVAFDGIFNSVVIGEQGRATGSNQVRLGNTSTTSIGGVVGFTNLSDGRFKKNVGEAVKGIDFIMRLRPVTYQLDLDGINKKLKINSGEKINEQATGGMDENRKTVFSGFIAQEVEKAAKEAGYDFSGVDKPKNENDFYGLRYSEFVVPLVKAVQEQQQMIEQLRKENAELQKRVTSLEKK